MADRFLKLNNYHGWSFVPTEDRTGPLLQQALVKLCRRDWVMWGQTLEHVNAFSGWDKLTPTSCRNINPAIKVYRYLPLFCKETWETDWGLSQSEWEAKADKRQGNPVPWWRVEQEDWWLRDGQGNKIPEPLPPTSQNFEKIWLLDPGKVGYREALVSCLTTWMSGQSWDGVLFDYWWPLVVGWTGIPQGYTSDAEWWSGNASRCGWKVFVESVIAGVKGLGYQVHGNEAGPYFSEYDGRDWQANPPAVNWTETRAYTRTLLDGNAYENTAYSWGSLATGDEVQRRIESQLQPPGNKLDWWAEAFLTINSPGPGGASFREAAKTSLASYLCGCKQDQANQTYTFKGDDNVWWHEFLDWATGTPSGPSPVKISGRHTWTRQYADGLVVVNYEPTAWQTSLSDRCEDADGCVYPAGSLNVPPFSGMILRRHKLSRSIFGPISGFGPMR